MEEIKFTEETIEDFLQEKIKSVSVGVNRKICLKGKKIIGVIKHILPLK